MNLKFSFKKYDESQRELWEEVNSHAKNSSFLSSIHWIDFQKSLGKEIDLYLIYDEKEKCVGNVYIEVYRRKVAKFAYCPYGPVINFNEVEITPPNPLSRGGTPSLEGRLGWVTSFYAQFKDFAKEYIKENNLTLFRFDPLLHKEYKSELKNLGFTPSLAPTQAKDTWVLDISKSEEELKKGMADTNRNMINRGIKNGIEIIKVGDRRLETRDLNEYLKAFYELMSTTTTRKGFVTYSFEYFKKQYELLNSQGMTEIFLAKYEGKYLAGALINYYKDTAYYSHAGSISGKEISKLGAPYFLIWNIILEAKDSGFSKFNFWGALPKEITKHSLRGVSDFKMKFGGESINLTGAFEVYNNPIKYFVHRMVDWWVYRKDRY